MAVGVAQRVCLHMCADGCMAHSVRPAVPDLREEKSCRGGSSPGALLGQWICSLRSLKPSRRRLGCGWASTMQDWVDRGNLII